MQKMIYFNKEVLKFNLIFTFKTNLKRGLAYDMNTAGNTESIAHITSGVNTVFLISSVLSFVGLAIVLLLARKQINEKAKETEESK